LYNLLVGSIFGLRWVVLFFVGIGKLWKLGILEESSQNTLLHQQNH